ncbi:YJR061W [Saccharomyces arboricola H-6]|uniref:YJR061W n=1 Tax=Saccharomyces arboricola (strain H-6 / AS 2.3317 / CBS 10644) TaxID=1160507 RepID=J8LLT9_SACAR|nr:YJR061W [Saccharomyces arboricola H-6]
MLSVRRFSMFVLRSLRLHLKKIAIILLAVQLLFITIYVLSDGSSVIGSSWKSLTAPFFQPLTHTSKGGIYAAFDLRSKDSVTGLYEKMNFDTSGDWVDTYTLKNNLLTMKMGADKGQVLESVDQLRYYYNDPRLIWSVVLDHLVASDSNEYAFSWYDWASFESLNKLLALKHTNISCQFMCENAFDKGVLEKVEEEVQEPLFITNRNKYDESFWYSAARKPVQSNLVQQIMRDHCKSNDAYSQNAPFELPFIIQEIYEKLRPEVYDLHAKNHLLYSNFTPLSLTVLDSDKDAYRINLKESDSSKSNIVQTNLLQEYIQRHKKEMVNGDLIFNHTSVFEKFLLHGTTKKRKLDIKGLDKTIFTNEYLYLSPSDFNFDTKAKITELETKLRSDGLSLHDTRYLKSLQTSIRTAPALQKKYFSEATAVTDSTADGHHRDKRFFSIGHNLLNDPQEFEARLSSLIRTFQKFTKANGLISWLSHGTLYGYLYDGLKFPWDVDHDLQMPIKHLHYLSQYFNQSLILEDPREGNGRYLLDVGNSITVRVNGNGKNNIDARFIDIDSGIYIDITGLSVSSDAAKQYMSKFVEEEESSDKSFPALIEDYNFDENEHFDEVDGREDLAKYTVHEIKAWVDSHPNDFDDEEKKLVFKTYRKELSISRSDYAEKALSPKQRYLVNKKYNLYNCRNQHFSSLNILSPLRNTMFNGVSAFIPNRPITALNNEYKVPPSYGFLTFQGKVYLPELRYWFSFADMKKFANLQLREPKITRLESSLNDLKFSDINLLLTNMIKCGFHSIFAGVFNSFESTAYRLKELEIQYDGSLSEEEKSTLLKTLRRGLSKNIKSPEKDPIIYVYERRLWEDVEKVLNASNLYNIASEVEKNKIEEFVKMSQKLYEKNLDEFKLLGSENNDTVIDLNLKGLNLFGKNKQFSNDIFSSDQKY